MASIKKRGNSYQISVSNGRDENYKQIIVYKTFTPDPTWSERRLKKELDKAAAAFEEEVKSSPYYQYRKMTFAEFCEKWYTDYVLMELELNTQVKYRDVLDNHLLPSLGSYPLLDLEADPLILQSFLNHYSTDTEYKRGSIEKFFNILRSIFRQAFCWNIIKENPMKRVRLPRKKKLDDSVNILTPDQVRRFLEFIKSEYEVTVREHDYAHANGNHHKISSYTRREQLSFQLQLLFHMCIYGGFRKGEILSLTWDDVNFETSEVTINKSVVSHKGDMVSKAPKTKGSVRTITLPDNVMEMIKQHKAQQKTEADRLAGYWQDNNLLFTRDDGTMMGYSTPYQALKKVIKRYNTAQTDEAMLLPSVTLHGLRHTHASILLANNVNVVSVAARLGHSQTSTTLDTYAHAIQSIDYTASSVLKNVLEDSNT